MNWRPLIHENLSFYEQRLNHLAADRPPRWGKLNAADMLCHLRRGLDVMTGHLQTQDISTLWSRSVMKIMALYVMPRWPRGIKSPEYFTPPARHALDHERPLLMATMQSFIDHCNRHPQSRLTSPIFGPLNVREARRLQGRHFAHHLDPFGC